MKAFPPLVMSLNTPPLTLISSTMPSKPRGQRDARASHVEEVPEGQLSA
jgi:hypothetical protein